MKKFLLSALILLTPTLQAATLFSLSEQSGNVFLEDYFKRTCEISQDGSLSRQVEKAIKNGMDWEVKIVESENLLLSDTVMMELRAQLEKAAKGTLQRRNAPRDVGAISYRGTLRGRSIRLFEMQEDAYSISNTAPEAESLISTLQELCKTN